MSLNQAFFFITVFDITRKNIFKKN